MVLRFKTQPDDYELTADREGPRKNKSRTEHEIAVCESRLDRYRELAEQGMPLEGLTPDDD